MNFPKDGDFDRLKDAFARKVQDQDDLQNELAGRDVGRIARFLGQDAFEERKSKGERKRTETAEMLSQLQLLLRDPVYAAAYEQAMGTIQDAERATERALEKALARLDTAKNELLGVKDRAMTLDDGTRVYFDDSGNLWTEEGTQIDLDKAASAQHWQPGMPGWSEFKAKRDAVANEQAIIDEIRRYQVDVLGSARDRMTDPKNPPSTKEIEEIESDVKDLMPPSVRAEIQQPDQLTMSSSIDRTVDVPKL